jgi:hypothetical protein
MRERDGGEEGGEEQALQGRAAIEPLGSAEPQFKKML